MALLLPSVTCRSLIKMSDRKLNVCLMQFDRLLLLRSLRICDLKLGETGVWNLCAAMWRTLRTSGSRLLNKLYQISSPNGTLAWLVRVLLHYFSWCPEARSSEVEEEFDEVTQHIFLQLPEQFTPVQQTHPAAQEGKRVGRCGLVAALRVKTMNWKRSEFLNL